MNVGLVFQSPDDVVNTVGCFLYYVEYPLESFGMAVEAQQRGDIGISFPEFPGVYDALASKQGSVE